MTAQYAQCIAILRWVRDLSVADKIANGVLHHLVYLCAQLTRLLCHEYKTMWTEYKMLCFPNEVHWTPFMFAFF